MTRQQAAQATGVSERTIYRRLEDLAFQQQITQARVELVSQTVGILAQASTTAAGTLAALLLSTSDVIRLGAARSLLDIGLKYRQAEQLEQRVTALEQALAEQAAKEQTHGNHRAPRAAD